MRSPVAPRSLLALACLAWCVAARAEPLADVEPLAADATADATGGATDGAPPAEATAQKAEDAEKTAKAAELTPILPSPKNPLRPAFQLYAEVDLPILGIGAVFASARLVRSQKAYCAPLCDPSGLNFLDKSTAGWWSPAWQHTSDYALIGLGAGAVGLLFAEEGFLPGLNDAAVVAESALAGIAISSVMTLAAGRPRPFLYGEKAPLSDRNGADAGLSFLSSHAVAGFAIVTSTFVTMRRLEPGTKSAWVVLGVGGALATFVATARVLGGVHFITDSVGGAIVGTSVGFLVPSLHGAPVTVVPLAGEGQRGLAIAARF